MTPSSWQEEILQNVLVAKITWNKKTCSTSFPSPEFGTPYMATCTTSKMWGVHYDYFENKEWKTFRSKFTVFHHAVAFALTIDLINKEIRPFKVVNKQTKKCLFRGNAEEMLAWYQKNPLQEQSLSDLYLRFPKIETFTLRMSDPLKNNLAFLVRVRKLIASRLILVDDN